MKESKNYIIMVLTFVILLLSILVVLFATGAIKNQEIESPNTSNNETDDSTNVQNKNDNLNNTLEKYLGKWYLDNGQDYSYINIKKKEDNSGYAVDIRVNKMGEYNDANLYCATNSGACYFSGDSEHNYSLLMANDQIVVIPDFAMVGTYWTFAQLNS